MTGSQEPAGRDVPFDTSRAHMARVYDFWLGGKDNFAADRAVAEQVAAAYADVVLAVRAQRAFLARAVHFLVTEAGIRQFLDIGTGLPSANNTHQVAQQATPATRKTRRRDLARALLSSSPEGATASWMPPCRPGQILAISQIASDVAADEVAEGVQRYNAQAAAPVAARSQAEVCRFFAGLELIEPGIVQVHRWRPGTGDLGCGRNLAIYAGVGRKP